MWTVYLETSRVKSIWETQRREGGLRWELAGRIQCPVGGGISTKARKPKLMCWVTLSITTYQLARLFVCLFLWLWDGQRSRWHSYTVSSATFCQHLRCLTSYLSSWHPNHMTSSSLLSNHKCQTYLPKQNATMFTKMQGVSVDLLFGVALLQGEIHQLPVHMSFFRHN